MKLQTNRQTHRLTRAISHDAVGITLSIQYESNKDRNKNLLSAEYINRIKPYWRDKTIDLQESDKLKIQLTIALRFISPKDVGKEHVMCSNSNNSKFTLYNNANEVVNESSSHLSQDIKTV